MFEKEKAKLATDGMYLKRYGEKKRNNKELVMIAVRQFGCALEFASPELQNDKDILAIVQKSGIPLL